MKIKHYCLVLSLFFILILCQRPIFGWGFFAHKWINREAIGALPEPMRSFFAAHESYISEHAIDPDLWRRDDPQEQYRHYIDIDMYGAFPFHELPRNFAEAKAKFGEETVVKRGIGPWWIEHTYQRLIRAMRAVQADCIVILATALGHYLSDLHVPLHSVENYDGQLTGNDGIHARFERWMIEKHADKLTLDVQPAEQISDPLSYTFDLVLQSVKLVDELLQADSRAKSKNGAYAKDEDYDEAYYAALFEQVGKMAERRMSEAASAIASFWYSAWLEAGRPDLEIE